jgi:hypothetical protein
VRRAVEVDEKSVEAATGGQEGVEGFLEDQRSTTVVLGKERTRTILRAVLG